MDNDHHVVRAFRYLFFGDGKILTFFALHPGISVSVFLPQSIEQDPPFRGS